VSYNDKHNEANGEDNRDGESHNRSWNCGVEGPTDDPDVTTLRRRQQRNLLTTLFLSQGVPMLLMGDEVSRTQQGNNNVYCQDAEISWFDWDDVADHEELLAFVRRLSHLRAEHPVFRRRRWFSGRSIRGDADDIAWLRPDATPMTDEDWAAGYAKSLAVVLNGHALEWPGPRGEPVADDSFLIVFNAHHEDLPWTAPGAPWSDGWVPLLDTAHPTLGTEELLASVATTFGATEETADALGALGAVMAVGAIGEEGPIEELKAGDRFWVTARSVVVLRSSR
jgi:isoamylase